MLITIHVQIDGMHCHSCKTKIETEIDILAGIKDITVNYETGLGSIEYEPQKITRDEIFAAIEKMDYKVTERKPEENQNTTTNKSQIQFKYRIFIAAASAVIFLFVYFLIKQFGLLEIMAQLNERQISYWLILLIGFLASFHCIGMCGGLVVAYTSHNKSNKDLPEKTFQPHLQYNLGRFISYSAIGAILGGFGSFFAINPTFTGTVTLIAGVFMILMGASFLSKAKWLQKIKLRTPKSIARFLFKQQHNKKPKGPFIVGLLNGFMPCGPLQAMQLFALTSGSISRGALSMGIYALGTIPLMFGFGSIISLISRDAIKKVMKFSGIIVIVLGVVMLNRGLTNFGLGFRALLPQNQTSSTEYLVQGDVQEYQTINMDLTYSGYSPNVLYVKKDIPVRWIINAKQISGCTDAIIMPDYNIEKNLIVGENIIEFLPTKVGEIKFSCWMQMVWGKFIVTENDHSAADQAIVQEVIEESASETCASGSGSCGGSCGQSLCGCSSRIKPNN